MTLRLLLSLLALLCFSARAETQAPARLDALTTSVRLAPFISVLEDRSGKLGIEDMARPEIAAAFRPLAGDSEVNFGYSASAFWLRFELLPEQAAPRHWLLEVAYASLDGVEVFTADGHRQAAGDLMPFAARPFAHRNFVFPLDTQPDAAQTVYLRVVSAGSLTVPATLWAPTALHAQDQALYSAFALYYGMLLALGLYNLLLYCSLRDRAYLAYVGFVGAMAIGQMSLNGFGNQFLWPDWPAWGNIALPSGFAATGFFGALFTRMFLNTKRTTPRLDVLILALGAGFLIAALAPLALPYRAAAVLTSLLGVAFSATAVGCGVLCQLRGHPGARIFLVAWSLLLVGVAVLGLRNFGWLPTTTLSSYGMQIGSALEMLLLSFALADRIHGIRRDKRQAQHELLNAKQAMVEALQRSEKELEMRVAQRTAELAEANAKLREDEAKLREMAHHDALTGLANRVLLEDRLQQAVLRTQRSGSGFALMVIDLDGFKPVNDSHGHGVGDELLRLIAQRLQDCVRASDTVARIGGDEFVLLIESTDDPQQALGIAEKIAAATSLPLRVGARVLEVSASIGISCWPKDAANAQGLLRAADRAMYVAKREGRGRCRLASTLGHGMMASAGPDERSDSMA